MNFWNETLWPSYENSTGILETNTIEIGNNFTSIANLSTGIIPYKRKLPTSYYPVLISTLSLSIVCLLVTIIIYRKLPEFRNIPGKNLISLSSCLTFTYALLMIDFISNHHMPKTSCKAMAILTHLSFLSVFMWTNVMSFDIWQTVISSNRLSESKTRRFKYWKYALYAWIGTIILALPAIIVDSANLLNDKVSPSFATRRCWLNGKPAFLIYFNAPVGLILFTNFTFFGLTARALIRVGKMTAKLNMNKDRKRFHLYLKLFIIMGMVWISEFIPWMTGYFQLYMVAGIITSLYGVFLFAIFICKKSVFQSLKKEGLCQNIFCIKNNTKELPVLSSFSQPSRNPSQSTFKSYTSNNSSFTTTSSIQSSQGNVSFNTQVV